MTAFIVAAVASIASAALTWMVFRDRQGAAPAVAAAAPAVQVTVAELHDRLADDDTRLLRQVGPLSGTDHRAPSGTPGGLANGAAFLSR